MGIQMCTNSRHLNKLQPAQGATVSDIRHLNINLHPMTAVCVVMAGNSS
jgi:hypothetical protein